MNWERRIPPFAEDALFVLTEVISRVDDESLPKADAEAILVDDARFTDADAEYALSVLQSRGHIYYVDGRVYITPTDE
jgi:hypothetical protein